MPDDVQWRARFDAEIRFGNGGSLTAEDFRLDVPGEDVTDARIGELLVRHLGLLMVGEVRISNRSLLREAHKGGRGVGSAPSMRRVIGLSGPRTRLTAPGRALAELVDLPAVVARLDGSDGPAEPLALAAFPVTGHALIIATPAPLPEATAVWLAERGPLLVAVEGSAPSALREASVPTLTGVTVPDELPPEGIRLHAVPLTPSGETQAAIAYAVAEPSS